MFLFIFFYFILLRTHSGNTYRRSLRFRRISDVFFNIFIQQLFAKKDIIGSTGKRSSQKA